MQSYCTAKMRQLVLSINAMKLICHKSGKSTNTVNSYIMNDELNPCVTLPFKTCQGMPCERRCFSFLQQNVHGCSTEMQPHCPTVVVTDDVEETKPLIWQVHLGLCHSRIRDAWSLHNSKAWAIGNLIFIRIIFREVRYSHISIAIGKGEEQAVTASPCHSYQM